MPVLSPEAIATFRETGALATLEASVKTSTSGIFKSLVASLASVIFTSIVSPARTVTADESNVTAGSVTVITVSAKVPPVIPAGKAVPPAPAVSRL